MEKKIRNLRADEIECRVGTISDKGLSLLIYKNSRVDQNILDETYGTMGWSRKHEKIGDSIFCTVSVKNENGEWISKQDVGNESFAESVKGAASDSFKRACFNWGIGRELYTSPFVWIPAEKVDIRHDGKKYIVKDTFTVSKFECDDRKNIVCLEISNQRGQMVYSFVDKGKANATIKTALSKVQEFKLLSEMERTGVSEKDILERYKLKSMESMTTEIYDRVMAALERTKNLAA